jgi:hypothetical protein
LLGIVLGIIAFALGVIGLRARASQPHIKGAVHAWIGIIVGGLFVLVWGVVILIMAGVISRY